MFESWHLNFFYHSRLTLTNASIDHKSVVFKTVCLYSAVGAVAMGDYLYVCGGFDGTSSLNTVERYDPAEDSWTEVARMTKFRSAAGT